MARLAHTQQSEVLSLELAHGTRRGRSTYASREQAHKAHQAQQRANREAALSAPGALADPFEGL